MALNDNSFIGALSVINEKCDDKTFSSEYARGAIELFVDMFWDKLDGEDTPSKMDTVHDLLSDLVAEDEREREVMLVTVDLIDALARLYFLYDMDEIAVGEVEQECHSAARLNASDRLNQQEVAS